MTVTDDGPLNPPRQKRSADTLRRIVEAATELLQERDFSDISVDDIVRRAGSSKGSFYQRFADKNGLLLYLLRTEHERAVGEWTDFFTESRWADSSLATVLDAFITRLMEIYRGRPSFMRAYAGQVFGGNDDIRALSVSLNRHVLALLRNIVLQKADEVEHPDPERASAFLLTAVITLLPPLFLSPTQELFPEPMSHDILETEVRVLVRSYLGVM